jgi:hypothetical protein
MGRGRRGRWRADVAVVNRVGLELVVFGMAFGMVGGDDMESIGYRFSMAQG